MFPAATVRIMDLVSVGIPLDMLTVWAPLLLACMAFRLVDAVCSCPFLLEGLATLLAISSPMWAGVPVAPCSAMSLLVSVVKIVVEWAFPVVIAIVLVWAPFFGGAICMRFVDEFPAPRASDRLARFIDGTLGARPRLMARVFPVGTLIAVVIAVGIGA